MVVGFVGLGFGFWGGFGVLMWIWGFEVNLGFGWVVLWLWCLGVFCGFLCWVELV